MQGSHVAALVHDQTYRETLRDLVQSHWPSAEVYDPFANHATSVGYDRDRARQVFMGHVEMCRQYDRSVVTITPLAHNWVVQLTSLAVYSDHDNFSHALRSGEIDRLLAQQSSRAAPIQ